MSGERSEWGWGFGGRSAPPIHSAPHSSAACIDNFIVDDQNKGSTSTAKNIGKCSFEESTGALILENLSKAIREPIVHLLLLGFGSFDLKTALQCVQRIRYDSRR